MPKVNGLFSGIGVFRLNCVELYFALKLFADVVSAVSVIIFIIWLWRKYK